MEYASKNRFPHFLTIVAGVGGYVGGRVAADSFDGVALGQLAGYFTAAATMLAGFLIALALGAAISDRKGPLGPLLFKIVVCLIVSLAASLAGLAPNLPADLMRQLFAVTVGGGAVSAIGVLTVAYAAVHSSPAQKVKSWTDRVAELGVRPRSPGEAKAEEEPSHGRAQGSERDQA